MAFSRRPFLMSGLMGFAGALAALTVSAWPYPALPAPAEIGTKRQARRRRAPLARHRGGFRLNRSQHWPYASTYSEARNISPYPSNPLR